MLNNVLYLNNMLFRFKKVYSQFFFGFKKKISPPPPPPLCSHWNEEGETLLHFFHSCLKAKHLWNKFRQYLSQFINISHSTPQSFIVIIFDNNQHSLLINHLLLIFKFYIYSARSTKQLNFNNLKKTIKKN